jgi:hypothetical protein
MDRRAARNTGARVARIDRVPKFLVMARDPRAASILRRNKLV